MYVHTTATTVLWIQVFANLYKQEKADTKNRSAI